MNENSNSDINIGVRFLTALFDPSDLVLFRPVETWTENGRKASRTLFKSTAYRSADPTCLRLELGHLRTVAETQHANIFFGVCPRFGGDGKYDRAFQIRVARFLWADLDKVSVEEALSRCPKAGLPPPSIAVNSGNGAHLYWRLDKAYVIDDAPAPPPVLTDWVKQPSGKSKPHHHLLIDGERVPLNQCHVETRLSERASHLEDIVFGVAQQIGGDCTHDLARLLRVPGTYNRKNERNGDTPRPTELVEFHPDRRYSIDHFEPFAKASDAKQRAQKVASVSLPAVRKLSTSKSDSLNELISASSIAEPGSRSEIDFKLCCFAIRAGASADEIWLRVQSVGKFAEAGETYFRRTWENAADEVRPRVSIANSDACSNFTLKNSIVDAVKYASARLEFRFRAEYPKGVEMLPIRPEATNLR